MTSVDGIALALLAAFVLLGALRGLVKDIALLVGIVAGAWLSWCYGAEVGRWLASLAVPAAWAGFLGYVLSFVAVVAAAGLVGAWISRLAHATPLGWLDRLLGAGLGLGKGLLLVWVIVTACVLVSPEGDAVVRSSVFVDGIRRAGDGLLRPASRPDREPRRKESPTKPVNRAGESLVFGPPRPASSAARLEVAVADGVMTVLDMQAVGSTISPMLHLDRLGVHCVWTTNLSWLESG